MVIHRRGSKRPWAWSSIVGAASDHGHGHPASRSSIVEAASDHRHGHPSLRSSFVEAASDHGHGRLALTTLISWLLAWRCLLPLLRMWPINLKTSTVLLIVYVILVFTFINRLPKLIYFELSLETSESKWYFLLFLGLIHFIYLIFFFFDTSNRM